MDWGPWWCTNLSCRISTLWQAPPGLSRDLTSTDCVTKGQQAAKAMMMYKLINDFVDLQPYKGILQPNLRPSRPRKLMVPLTWTRISHIFWHLFFPSVNHTWNATASITVAPPSPTKHSSAVLRAGRASTPIKSSTHVNFLIKLLGFLPYESRTKHWKIKCCTGTANSFSLPLLPNINKDNNKHTPSLLVCSIKHKTLVL